jgi:hypothetical protein
MTNTKLYHWHEHEAADGEYTYYRYPTPMMCGNVVINPSSKLYQWQVFDGGGNLLAAEYRIASKQNAQRKCVAWITNKEKEG